MAQKPADWKVKREALVDVVIIRTDGTGYPTKVWNDIAVKMWHKGTAKHPDEWAEIQAQRAAEAKARGQGPTSGPETGPPGSNGNAQSDSGETENNGTDGSNAAP